MQINDTLKPAEVALLYQSHHAWLRGWLRSRVGCGEHAADLAQDTFVRLLRARQVSPLKEPRAYLSSIAPVVPRMTTAKAAGCINELRWPPSMTWPNTSLPGRPSACSAFFRRKSG